MTELDRPRVVALVQARMGSSRLPGKMLMDIQGQPMLARVLERARMAASVDQVALATSDRDLDSPIADLAVELGITVHRGSEQDVLKRMREAAQLTRAEFVVRVTGDCPLLDPWVVDEVVAALLDSPTNCGYASNILRRTYPRGLDTEVLSIAALERIDRLATSSESREHVTLFAYRERPDLFQLRSVELNRDYSDLDWSVDDASDLKLVRSLYVRHGLADRVLPWQSLVEGGPPTHG